MNLCTFFRFSRFSLRFIRDTIAYSEVIQGFRITLLPREPNRMVTIWWPKQEHILSPFCWTYNICSCLDHNSHQKIYVQQNDDNLFIKPNLWFWWIGQYKFSKPCALSYLTLHLCFGLQAISVSFVFSGCVWMFSNGKWL